LCQQILAFSLFYPIYILGFCKNLLTLFSDRKYYTHFAQLHLLTLTNKDFQSRNLFCQAPIKHTNIFLVVAHKYQRFVQSSIQYICFGNIEAYVLTKKY